MIIIGMIIPAAVVYFKSLPPTLIINTPYIEYVSRDVIKLTH